MYFLLDNDQNRIAPVRGIMATYHDRGESRIVGICGSFSKYIPAPTFGIEKVIFNDPATIVLWKDGTKTVVKCQEGDEYSKETGLALCIAKKALGNKSNFNNEFKRWIQ